MLNESEVMVFLKAGFDEFQESGQLIAKVLDSSISTVQPVDLQLVELVRLIHGLGRQQLVGGRVGEIHYS